MSRLEAKRVPDGRILARRSDRRPLTPEDREEARRLARLHDPPWIECSRPPEDKIPEQAPKPEHPGPEALAARVLAEFQPDEADRIVRTWHQILGIQLDKRQVASHLEALRKWQARWVRR